MSCRRTLLIASALAGCVDDPVVIQVTATATEPIELAPGEAEGAPEDVTYRWELVLEPAASQAEVPQGAATATFVPNYRGVYVVERWLAYGLSDRLTHDFVIHTIGVAPEAILHGNATATVGTAAMLDASQSRSAESLALRFQWRLAERPRDSAAMVSDPQAAITSFVPDVAGTYAIELAVFDGELWSQPHATLVVTAQ